MLAGPPADVLVKGQNVIGDALKQQNFRFRYRD